MRAVSFLAIFIGFSVLTGCSGSSRNETAQKTPDLAAAERKTSGNKDYPVQKPEARERNSKAGEDLSKAACLSVDTGAKVPLKSQTFPIDFEPFQNSCFVTVHDPEKADPPIGSEIAIYKNGQKIYKFDTRYHEDAATCWVEAVSFQDLNADKLTDIIVVGQCGAKSGPIQGNEVFINTGKAFHTSVKANDKLEELDKIEDIAQFVKKNQTEFNP